ncbi:MAG: AmmeMemoRadiSam system protein A [Bacteroidota bacterium]
MNLTNEEKRTLVKIARSAICCALENKTLPSLNFQSEALNRSSGVFVTLRIGEHLRGCIGYIEPLFPLARATQEVAVKAAIEDPRFMPVTTPELDKIIIEISVLSPLEELKDIETIEIGKHGLVIDAGYRRGLLLPQVATEYNWDRKQFLKQISLKAGLPPDAWKRREVKLFTFTVEKFDESEFVSSEEK